MNTFTTAVSFFGEDQVSPSKVDTIEHEGQFWLVPEWIVDSKTGTRMPARIILLDKSMHQKTTGHAFGDFVLNQLIPRAVFEGRQTGGPYTVVERPDIKIQPLK
jgi:hypothetical protein